MLAAAVEAFPAGTVFLAVVDPGVGTSRRALAVQTEAHRFVAPDNGLLTHILADHHAARVHAITNAGLFRFHVSPTFHGRDVFGPVAGHLARGMPIEEVGPAVGGSGSASRSRPCARAATASGRAEVVHVDRFGNLTTNVSDRDLSEMLSNFGGDPTEVVVVVEGAVLPLVRTYGDVSEGEPCALVGQQPPPRDRRSTAATPRGSSGRRRGASVRIRPALSGRS